MNQILVHASILLMKNCEIDCWKCYNSIDNSIAYLKLNENNQLFITENVQESDYDQLLISFILNAFIQLNINSYQFNMFEHYKINLEKKDNKLLYKISNINN